MEGGGSSAGSPQTRGSRARSSSFLSEADAPSGVGDSGSSSPGNSSNNSINVKKEKKKGTQLSKKTLNIVTNLSSQQAAILRPAASSTGGLNEEELEERKLAQEERAKLHDGGRGGRTKGKRPAKGRNAKGKAGSSEKDTSGDSNRGNASSGDPNRYDHYIKLLLLGDGGVGKTSLMLRYAENEFSSNMMSTMGVDFKVRFMDLDNNQRIKCQIWDTAGQERFHVITRAYYRGAQGIVLTYDVTDPESFTHVGYWMDNIQKHAANDVMVILVANKIDMPDRKVATEEGEAVAAAHDAAYYETSAKDGTNVAEAFEELSAKIAKQMGERAATVGKGSGKSGMIDVSGGGKRRAPYAANCLIL